MEKKYTNQSGFSIIEILVTIFLVSVAFLLFYASSNAVLINRAGRQRETALRIADKKMQSLRTTDFATFPTSGSFSDSLMSGLPGASGTITITDVNATLKDVLVTVTWRNIKGNSTQKVELETYVTQGGLGQ